jgi:signal peptidase
MAVRKKRTIRSIRKSVITASRVIIAFIMILMLILLSYVLKSHFTQSRPSIAGFHLFVVLGGSMSPAFEAGSIVLVQRVNASEIIAGDIITYRDYRRDNTHVIVTHRVMEVLETEPVSFVTRGDANEVNDPRPVAAANLIGRVAYTIPYLGRFLSFIRTRTGLLVMVIVPAVLIIFSELRKLIKYSQDLESLKIKEVAARYKMRD